ncbi:tyrosine-type recombinase/integrase [Salipiger sp. PrR003]|uniref:tyrosine-type recombinase/integrase n=1 Tax=Salipiger sp. PrR003 TaxID=2706776 RepID=UPI0013DD2960|nr:tyrosine-type recombinase/integrase [Salipiger sp. PrR003]NDV52150.1 tyrosine-type recombinase/integrase [Salipiger sp. PrR003]NDV52176.1 tyrosine-type recombinase/integrase [Salipiger sp. PrR003]
MKKGKKFRGVNRHEDRHGKVRWRLRRTINGRKIDTYLPGPYGSDAFKAAYEIAINDTGKDRTKSPPGTFNYVVEEMMRSRHWREGLRESTRTAKRGRLDWIREKIGRFQIADLRPHHVVKLMEMKGGPQAANRLHKELSEIYLFAKRSHGFDGLSPTSAVAREKATSKGFHTWTPDEVSQFRDHHKTGTMARLAFEIALGTGAARQDVARMGAANVRGGAIVYSRGKTGGRVELPLALLPDLAAELGRKQQWGEVFVTKPDGKPYAISSFGNWFRDCIAAAGLPAWCSIHGLRKHGATRLAERGATEWQVMAFLGHSSPHEARRYVAEANRVTMVADALRLLPQEKLSNLPARLDKSSTQTLEKKAEK